MEISNQSITPLVVTRSFPGRYDSLASIGDFIRGIAHKAGLGSFAAYTVEMAVDEACSNIIEHAYGSEDKGQITCTCKVTKEGLTIILEDHGRPFDPDLIGAPDISSGLEDRPTHGLGLFFIRQWMDKVDFDFKTGNGNRLTLFKKRQASPESKPTKKR